MTRHCVCCKVACARTKGETNRCELLTKLHSKLASGQLPSKFMGSPLLESSGRKRAEGNCIATLSFCHTWTDITRPNEIRVSERRSRPYKLNHILQPSHCLTHRLCPVSASAFSVHLHVSFFDVVSFAFAYLVLAFLGF